MNIKTIIAFISIVFLFLVVLNDYLIEPQKVKLKSFFPTSPLLLSHRGSRYLTPENTIHAHTWALKLGANVLEFDVRLTKDKRLVVFHDEMVDRVLNANGPVRNFTLEVIQNFDAGYWFTPYNHSRSKHMPESERYPFRGKGLRVPEIKEFLDTFPDVAKNIEIKDPDLLAVDLLWEEFKNRPGILDQVSISSRWCDSIDKIRLLSKYSIATSACEKEVVFYIALTKFHLFNLWHYFKKPVLDAYQIPYFTDGLDLFTSDYIKNAQSTGQRLIYWVVNDQNLMKQMYSQGLGVITDRPDLAVEVLNQLNLTQKHNIPSSVINTTSSFFVPDWSPPETHTCVSVSCVVFKNIWLIAGSVLLGSFVMIGFGKIRTTKSV